MATSAATGSNPGTHAEARMGVGPLLFYGAFGFPLALVALPIYVYVAKFYSDRFGLSLTLIGGILLATRLLDTFTDPLLGWWVDRSRSSSSGIRLSGYRRVIVYALPLLALGYAALFHPQLTSRSGTPSGMSALWLALSLVVVYLGFSVATIAYQSWGAELSTDPVERTRITGMREGLGLIGIIIAAVLPEQLGMSTLTIVFIVSLLGSAWLLLALAPHPVVATRSTPSPASLRTSLTEPLINPRFRMLLWIFLANGIASAIPANLILFFVRDVLQLSHSGLFLGAYFIAGACSIPLWIALAKRLGLARAWFVGMLASIAAFVWAYGLGAGDQTGFLMICIVSGFALGADLALPAALLAGVISAAGHRGSREGAYFGLWSFVTKLNLALAAGISLPLLGLLGYVPLTPSAEGAHALSVAYALVPCVLKLLAVGLLWRSSFFKESI